MPRLLLVDVAAAVRELLRPADGRVVQDIVAGLVEAIRAYEERDRFKFWLEGPSRGGFPHVASKAQQSSGAALAAGRRSASSACAGSRGRRRFGCTHRALQCTRRRRRLQRIRSRPERLEGAPSPRTVALRGTDSGAWCGRRAGDSPTSSWLQTGARLQPCEPASPTSSLLSAPSLSRASSS